MHLVAIAFGGALGSLGRYGLATLVARVFGPGPLGVFLVNVSGAFAIGFVMVVGNDALALSSETRRFLTVGVLGGYTTFSALMYDTFALLEAGSYARAIANSAGSVAAGLIAVALGAALARTM